MEIPEAILSRRDLYCQKYGCSIRELRGWGMEAFIWQTEEDDILKVHRTAVSYHIERDVYRRLDERGLRKLQGFRIPRMFRSDDATMVLQISYVKPPYILDFGAATLDRPPDGVRSEERGLECRAEPKVRTRLAGRQAAARRPAAVRHPLPGRAHPKHPRAGVQNLWT